MTDKDPTGTGLTIQELHPDWTPPSEDEIKAIIEQHELQQLMETPPEGYDRQSIARVTGKHALQGDLVDLQPARGSHR